MPSYSSKSGGGMVDLVTMKRLPSGASKVVNITESPPPRCSVSRDQESGKAKEIPSDGFLYVVVPRGTSCVIVGSSILVGAMLCVKATGVDEAKMGASMLLGDPVIVGGTLGGAVTSVSGTRVLRLRKSKIV